MIEKLINIKVISNDSDPEIDNIEKEAYIKGYNDAITDVVKILINHYKQ